MLSLMNSLAASKLYVPVLLFKFAKSGPLAKLTSLFIVFMMDIVNFIVKKGNQALANIDATLWRKGPLQSTE